MTTMDLFGSDDKPSRRERAEQRIERGGFSEANTLDGKAPDLKRVIDEEAGVVIYARSSQPAPNIYGYGLAAVPIKDTDLENREGGD